MTLVMNTVAFAGMYCLVKKMFVCKSKCVRVLLGWKTLYTRECVNMRMQAIYMGGWVGGRERERRGDERGERREGGKYIHVSEYKCINMGEKDNQR